MGHQQLSGNSNVIDITSLRDQPDWELNRESLLDELDEIADRVRVDETTAMMVVEFGKDGPTDFKLLGESRDMKVQLNFIFDKLKHEFVTDE